MQGSLKKLHLLICDKNNSQAPWAKDLDLWVAKASICDEMVLILFLREAFLS